MLDSLYTLFAFILALILSPAFILLFIVVRVCHNAWLQLLSTIHPDLEFIRETTVRTLVDTRRNQGIFTVLLRVEGAPQIDLVRKHLQDVVNRVDKLGEPRFPKLRKHLVSRWGSYAWKRPQKEFSCEQILVVQKSTHRGRPLTETNVREHVSDIVTRYLPRGAPPWQLVVLPCGDAHYLLLRMHHLLLTDGDVNIADLLPLAAVCDPMMTPEALQHYVDSPLMNILERPDHIRVLYATVTENLNNKWNEFSSNYDPVNRPEILKGRMCVSGFLATIFVTVVVICRKIWLGFDNVTPKFRSRVKYVKACIRRECMVRGVTLKGFFASILNSLHPLNIVSNVLMMVYNVVSVFLWKGPVRVFREIQALVLRLLGVTRTLLDRSTTVDTLWNNIPLICRALSQVYRFWLALYTSPRLLLTSTLLQRGWPGGTQVPLCGRKVVCWSQAIPGARLRHVALNTGTSCTEVLLTCLAASLGEYYKGSALEMLPVTVRRISKSYLFSSGPNVYRFWLALYTSPRLLLTSTLLQRGWPGGTQVPLCGRKVVCWSQAIPGARLRHVAHNTGTSCTEVLLTCLAASLGEYYKGSALEMLPVTVRRISKSYLFSSGPNVRPQDAVSGMLCLHLPTIPPHSYPGALHAISDVISCARKQQASVYLASVLQTKHRIVTRALPSVLVTVLFRFLSKKYTVAVTELMAGDETGQVRYTTWGSRISDVVYWRPPQANISLSLCLNYYGDEVTLAVMSDALLSPHHVPIAEDLPRHLEALAEAVGL